MCGFVGIVNTSHDFVDQHLLQSMANAQRHRGPDDQKLYLDSLSWASIGFAFNRLSIIDLSEAGQQPMQSLDGQVTLMFNGELYNAAHWRAHLGEKGYAFRGRSDTEVLLNMYLEFGMQGMLDRSNAMLAIALVDLRINKIFLARDRLGIKPLYLAQIASGYIFSSEIKSFLRHPEFRSVLNQEALSEYFIFRYTSGEKTLFKNVEQVCPGQYLELSSQGVFLKTYWKPSSKYEVRTEHESILQFGEALRASVSGQMVSDVPVGCQLSGGLDSSMVAYYSKQVESKLNAFSIIVQDKSYSEEKWIRQASRRIDIPVHSTQMGEKEFADNFESASWHLEQPLNHMNSIGIFLLAKQAKSHVKVLLSGEGADELLGGYGRFHRALLRSYFLNPEDLKKWFILAASPMQRYLLDAVYPKHHWDSAVNARVALFGNESDFMKSARNYELQTYLVDLLIRQDKMTMAHSVENRVPFLDNQLVDFVSGLNSRYCIGLSPLNSKYVLKKLASQIFEQSFVYRKKQSFGIPLGRFLGSKWMRDRIEALLESMKKRQLVETHILKSWYCHRLTEQPIAEAFWIFLAFEQWCVQYLDHRY